MTVALSGFYMPVLIHFVKMPAACFQFILCIFGVGELQPFCIYLYSLNLADF